MASTAPGKAADSPEGTSTAATACAAIASPWKAKNSHHGPRAPRGAVSASPKITTRHRSAVTR